MDNHCRHSSDIFYSKPDTALAGPWPEPSIIPRCTAEETSADYESELVIIIGRVAKNVTEEGAMDYVVGYTAANDISARKSWFCAVSVGCF